MDVIGIERARDMKRVLQNFDYCQFVYLFNADDQQGRMLVRCALFTEVSELTICDIPTKWCVGSVTRLRNLLDLGLKLGAAGWKA